MSAIFITLLNIVVILFLECIALLPEIKYYYLLTYLLNYSPLTPWEVLLPMLIQINPPDTLRSVVAHVDTNYSPLTPWEVLLPMLIQITPPWHLEKCCCPCWYKALVPTLSSSSLVRTSFFLYSCKINPLTFLCPIFVIFYYGKSATHSYVMLSPTVAGRCVVLPHPFVPVPVSLVTKPLIAATMPS